MVDYDVVIAGAGPVGMTIAIDLAQRNVRVLVVEKNPTTTQHPKMDITNGRSMEIFHKLGIGEQLRAAAIPEEHCFDVSWITGLSGYELIRHKYPSPKEIREKAMRVNDGTFLREPPMRVSQTVLEPVLHKILLENPLADIRHSHSFEGYTDNGDSVEVTVCDRNNDENLTFTCRYLVGADGGRSVVRQQAGISLRGRASIAPYYMIHYRSNDREWLQRWGIAWHNRTPYGSIIAQNDHDTWTTHVPLDPNSSEEPNAKKLLRRVFGRDLDIEVLVENRWSPNLLVADKYSAGRVFLAGDAVHQYIPTGGFGMNTGIGDASNLSWKLAAVINGYADEYLLDSYEIERRPVAVRNCQAAGANLEARLKIRALYVDEIHDETPAGEAAREKASKGLAEIGNLENEAWGIEHGFSYTGSPAVCTEYLASNDLKFDPAVYTPSTRPGERLPHVFLSDGVAIHDMLGPWLTLLCFDDFDASAFETAAAKRNMPLKVIHLPDEKLRGIYQSSAVLVRPDLHVAWRQTFLEDDADAVIGCISGEPGM